MLKFSLTFLAITLVALFVVELSSGQPANGSQSTINNKTEESTLSPRQPGGKICCTPTLDRNDYIVTPGLGAHKLHKRGVSWNDARLICLMEGAHLALLDSARKTALFEDWMTKESKSLVWIGFHDLFQEGSWTTVTGELVDTMAYQPWAKGQPNNFGNIQHCGFLWNQNKNGIGAHDGPCANNYSFICEINLCSALNPITVSNGKLGN